MTAAIQASTVFMLPNLLAGKPGHQGDSPVVAYEVGMKLDDYRTIIRPSTDWTATRTATPIDYAIPGGYEIPTVLEFMKLFGSPDRLLAEVGPGFSPVDFLGKEWDPQAQMAMFRNSAIRQANLVILNHLRDVNRTLLADLEQMNPIDPSKPEDAVMLQLAEATHQSWLEGEKQKNYYVAYTQEVHDALIALASAGKLKEPLTADLLTNPKKKHKITVDQIVADLGDPLVANLEKAMGRSINSGFKINTVAAEWKDAISLNVSEEWSKKRPGYLYGLQADSVAAVYSVLTTEEIILPLIEALEAGDAERVMDSLVDTLRAINVGWRVNNAWGGWNDALQNRPFGLADIGGIGIDDIVRDALVLKPILLVLNQARVQGRLNTYPIIADRIKNLFEHGVEDYLADLADPEQLEVAVARNQARYI